MKKAILNAYINFVSSLLFNLIKSIIRIFFFRISFQIKQTRHILLHINFQHSKKKIKKKLLNKYIIPYQKHKDWETFNENKHNYYDTLQYSIEYVITVNVILITAKAEKFTINGIK